MFNRRPSYDASPAQFNAVHPNGQASSSYINRFFPSHQKRPSTAPPSPSLPVMQTKNTLRSKERADLVKRTRKLEQVLGVAMHVVGPENDAKAEAPVQSETTSSTPKPVAPRRRLKSLRRPSVSRPELPPSVGILVSTSTSVHVDTMSSSEATPLPPPSVSVNAPPPVTPVPQRSASLPTDIPSTPEGTSEIVVRPKKSLVFTHTHSLPANDAPVLQLVPTSPLSVFQEDRLSVASATRNGRQRSESVTSTSTFDSIGSTATVLPRHSRSRLNVSVVPPSPPSSVHDLSHEIRQRQLHTVNKLQRHFGESIPPELVIGPTASETHLPPVTAPPPSTSRPKPVQKRSLSIRIINRKKPSGGELRPGRPGTSATSPAFGTRSAPERRHSHRRIVSDDPSVRSMAKARVSAGVTPENKMFTNADWTSTLTTLPHSWASDDVATGTKPRRKSEDSRRTTRAVPQGSRSLDVRMSRKDKALNVRRATKLTKKFGEAPPNALFSITNTSSTIRINIEETQEDAKEDVTIKETPRSPGAASTWSFHGHENELPVPESRKRLESVSSVGSRSRANSLGSSFRSSLRNSVVSDGDFKMTLEDSSAEPTKVKSVPSPILVSFPLDESPVSPSETSASITPKATGKLEPVVNEPAPTPAPTPVVSSSRPSKSFKSRRRQATKLAKFFGVEYPDLYQAMVVAEEEEVLSDDDDDEVAPLTKTARPEADNTPGRQNLADVTRWRQSLALATGSGSGSASSLKIGDSDSCRWSAKDPDEVQVLMSRLREMKA